MEPALHRPGGDAAPASLRPGWHDTGHRLLEWVCSSPWSWTLMGVALLGLDRLSTPWIQVPIGFAIPTVLAAWKRSLARALPFAILGPFARVLLFWHDGHGFWISTLVVNAVLRASVLTLVAILVQRVVTLSLRVRRLESLLPICAWCGRVRTEDNAWIGMESYLVGALGAAPTHGICPDCAARLMADEQA